MIKLKQGLNKNKTKNNKQRIIKTIYIIVMKYQTIYISTVLQHLHFLILISYIVIKAITVVEAIVFNLAKKKKRYNYSQTLRMIMRIKQNILNKQ